MFVLKLTQRYSCHLCSPFFSSFKLFVKKKLRKAVVDY
nr:MAG TPA: hypothetical protein [Caudoviricetes sp.]